ncbi:MAG: hypothetical protein IIZ12_05535 [Eggerthellaceae bacterium]|nr:hypothetical protein [Eggerthellaceae bacterium]
MGDSGTGKSTSIRTFNEGEVEVINVQGKLMPFFTPKVHQVNVPQIAAKNNNALKVDIVRSWLAKHTEHKAVVVDDCGYCITEMYMRWAVSGDEMMNDQLGVYKEIAGRMWYLFQRVIEDGEADRIVYFIFHEETDNRGKVDLLTVGKLLNEKIKIRGLVTCTLQSAKEGDRYVFHTNNGNPAKSPMGLFEDEIIDNDLKMVDSRIREAYGIEPLKAVKE